MEQEMKIHEFGYRELSKRIQVLLLENKALLKENLHLKEQLNKRRENNEI